MCNTTTNYNNRNNTPLSNVNTREEILQDIREEEDEEEAITDTNNVTADMFRLESSPQRENSNAIFASEKLEN